MTDENPTPRRKRPTRAAVEQMLSGAYLDVVRPNLTTTADGDPLGVERVPDEEMSGHPTVLSLESLSWSQDEWDDPRITE